MELQALLSLLLPFLLILLIAITRKVARPKAKSGEPDTPPGPRGLPFIGNMHQLAGDLPFRALRDLARRHGPLMRLRVGQVDLVVASSREAAEAVLKTHDLNFASRPELSAARVLAYGCTDIAFSPYGAYWKQLRKICFMELLGARRVKSFAAVRAEEASKFLREIAQRAASAPRQPVDLSAMLYKLTNDVVSRAAFGKRRGNHETFMKAAKEALEMASLFSFADVFPSLAFVDVLTGARGRLERIRRELDDTFDEIIRDHAEKKRRKEEVEDLVDVMLRLMDDPDLEIPMSLDNVKAVILDLFVAGTETSASVVEWAMSELILNPEAMRKAQAEAREALKGKDAVQEADVADLHYLRLVVKETLRIHPPVPLLIPRVCKDACAVMGHAVPAGSRVFVNVWALGRDPLYWGDAERFRPERFDGSAVDFKGGSFEYLPFGAGRRVCPGMTFGLASVDLVLAQLLYHFDWGLPEGVRPEQLDMSETFGSNASRKTELLLVATPRCPLPA